MNAPRRWWLQLTRVVLTQVAPACILFGSVLAVQAQNSVTSGLTRPGWPNDQASDAGGGIKFVADDPDARAKAVGGTIYSEVLKRTRDGDDPWGTQLEKFVGTFQPGLDFNGVSSPALDIRAEYLYLYQVVNDRRTDAPIESVAIKLQVEMKDITSWGYFDGVGFGVTAQADDRGEAVRPVSFSNVVGAEGGKGVYKSPAPIQQQGLLKLTRIPTRKNPNQPKAGDSGVVRVIWDALDPAHNPDYVMLLSNSDFESAPSMRAIWSSGGNLLQQNLRSTIFGFTSNLPPVIDAVRLRTTKDASQKASTIRFIGSEPSAELEAKEGVVKDGIVGAVGKVPTPRPEVAEVATGAPPLQSGFPQQQGSAGGNSPLGGFGGGAPAVSGGGLGGARPPGTGGGGIAGGGGGEQQGQQGQDHQAKINFNATLTNQQTNGCCCDNGDPGGGNVVPEPATLLGASLGLPVVFYLWRRRTRQAVVA